MSKYIVVKNCPAIRHNDEFELDNRCDANNVNCFFCENISDCLIKQVIDKCNSELGERQTIGRNDLAKDILNMFEIERVKE